MPFVAGDEDSDLSVHEFFERFSATCHPKNPCSCETLLSAAMGYPLSLYIFGMEKHRGGYLFLGAAGVPSPPQSLKKTLR